MRRLICGALWVVVLACPFAQAQRAPDPAPLQRHQLTGPADKPRPEEMQRILGTAANEAELLSHRHYKTKDGHEVHSPAKSTHDQVPSGASAKCLDGTYSFSQHRRGTCSHHGGVASWL
jgi:Ni/Co efflux regulator RcnB